MSGAFSEEVIKWVLAFTGIDLSAEAAEVAGAKPEGGPTNEAAPSEAKPQALSGGKASADGSAVPGITLGGPRIEASPFKPKRAGKESGPDLSEEAIEAVLNDPKKRVEELLKHKIPRLSEKYDSDTPLTQFFEDCKSGIESAQKYAEYMGKVADYALKYGKGLEKIAEAGTKLKAVADKLKGGLGKVGGVVAKAHEVSQFVDAVGDFANVSRTLDMKHIENVQHWATSMENLWDKAAPFGDWVKEKAVDAAIADGSELGGAVAASIAIVAAQFVVGLKTLKVGLANEKEYIDKLNARVHEIEVYSGQAPPDPPTPAAPPAWESREEEAARVRAGEDDQLRRAMEDERSQRERQKANEKYLAEQAAAQKKKDEEETAARKKAEEEKAAKQRREVAEAEWHKKFVAVYQSARPGFLSTLRQAATQPDSTDRQIAWWDCLTFDEKENLRLVNARDDSMYSRVGPRKRHVSNAEADQEIGKFLALADPFQPVNDLYWAEHAKAFPQSAAGD